MDEIRRTGEHTTSIRERGLSFFRRISWGAVFAGLLVALVVQLILSLLGLGIGMGTIDPLEERNPIAGLGTGAVIWWIVSILIALFTGGYVAGRLAGIPRSTDSILHGLLTFSLFTIVSLFLVTTTVGAIISGVGGIVGKTFSTVGEGVAAGINKAAGEVGTNIDLENIKNESMTFLSQAGVSRQEIDQTERDITTRIKSTAGAIAMNPQKTGEETENLVNYIFNRTENLVNDIDRESLANAVSERTGKSKEESRKVVDNWFQSYEDLKRNSRQIGQKVERETREMTDQAASAISKAAIFMFFGLLLGAGAAAYGGKLGEPHEIQTTEVEKEVRDVL